MTEYVGCLRSEARRKRERVGAGLDGGPGPSVGRAAAAAAAAAARVLGEQMSHRSAFVPRLAGQ